VTHPTIRKQVQERDGGLCVVCGLPVSGGHVHHRKPRGMGGRRLSIDTLSNLILLHPDCHLKHVESKRRQALDNGWLIIGSAYPETVPIRYMLTRTVYLLDNGDIIETERNEK